MAVDRDGKIVALRVHTNANLGAYLSTFAPLIPTFLYGPLLSGAYKIPEIYCEVVGSLTNTTPVDAYRGAGRPEATYLLERMCDLTAKAIGHGRRGVPAEELRAGRGVPVPDAGGVPVRQRQLRAGARPGAPDDRLPEVPGRPGGRAEEGAVPGDRLRHLHRGLRPGALRRWRARSAPRPGLWESAQVRVHPDREGHGLHGLAHPRPGARDHLRPAGGRRAAGALRGRRDRPRRHRRRSRSAWAPTAAARPPWAARRSTAPIEKIKEKGKKIAAHLLEASEADIEYQDGQVRGAGLARAGSRAFGEVALMAYLAHNLPKGLEPGLEATSFWDPSNFVFPFGTHIAVVEVERQDRQGEAPALRGGGRRRERHQPDDRRRHGPRGHRPGSRPGALRVRGLRRRTASSRAAA